MIEPVLQKLRDLSARGRANAKPEESYQWDALDTAIEITATHSRGLEDVGLDALKGLLRMWSGEAPVAQKIASIRVSSFAELTAGNIADAMRLDVDTEAREKAKQKVIDWLLELGVVGAKLILAVAFV